MAVQKKPAPLTGNIDKTLIPIKLMGNQDTINKGDGLKPVKVPTTILLPADLKEEAQEYAALNGVSLTSLIVRGLRLQLEH